MNDTTISPELDKTLEGEIQEGTPVIVTDEVQGEQTVNS